jgi:hypothetical protein
MAISDNDILWNVRFVSLKNKSNNFYDACQVKPCQKSKSLPSPKQECSLLNNK